MENPDFGIRPSDPPDVPMQPARASSRGVEIDAERRFVFRGDPGQARVEPENGTFDGIRPGGGAGTGAEEWEGTTTPRTPSVTPHGGSAGWSSNRRDLRPSVRNLVDEDLASFSVTDTRPVAFTGAMKV